MDDLAAEFPERFGVFVDVTEQRPFKQATEPVLEGLERGRDQRDAGDCGTKLRGQAVRRRDHPAQPEERDGVDGEQSNPDDHRDETAADDAGDAEELPL